MTSGADYTQSGNNVTNKKEYLETQGVDPTGLTFNFSTGNMQTLAITVSDTTPQNSTIAPTTATFDKNTANTTTGHYQDVTTVLTLNGNTLTSIQNGATTLTSGADYTQSGNNVMLKKV